MSGYEGMTVREVLARQQERNLLSAQAREAKWREQLDRESEPAVLAAREAIKRRRRELILQEENLQNLLAIKGILQQMQVIQIDEGFQDELVQVNIRGWGMASREQAKVLLTLLDRAGELE